MNNNTNENAIKYFESKFIRKKTWRGASKPGKQSKLEEKTRNNNTVNRTNQ